MNNTEMTITVNPLFEQLITNKTNNNIIDFKTLKNNSIPEKVNILPSLTKDDEEDLASEHDAEPIKDINDIKRISDYFISKKQYRNNMLFIVGINVGLRCSDLRMLRFKDFINDNSTFKDEVIILERKTKNTRKIRKNRHIIINNAVRQAIALYLENNVCSLDDYLFTSESNNGSNDKKPLARYSIERILKNVVKQLDINVRAGTHMLRKTFSYHVIMQAKDRDRAIELLQKILGHSSSSITLRYAGLTNDEIRDSYKNLNLGLNFIELSNVK